MFRYLLLAAFIPALALAQTAVAPCTGGRPLPVEVRVPGCTAPPCSFQQGSTINAAIDFVALPGALSLITDVWLTIGGTHSNYVLTPGQQNGCLNLSGAACPLGINQAATHNFQFTITAGLPPSPASIEVSLLNHNSDTLYCAVLNVFITA